LTRIPITRSERLILVCTELFAPGGIQRVGRAVVDALGAGAAPLAVGSLRDAAVPDGYRVPPGTDMRLAAGSRLKLGAWALGQARQPCGGAHVLLMHVHLAPLALPLIARGARVVAFLYGVEVWRPLTTIERFVFRRAARLVAISEYTAQRFREANPWIGSRAIAICPLGVTSDVALPGPADQVAADADFALIVSRISREDRYKGHERLIRAWAGVRQRVHGARLVIVGDGDDRARLEALARELGLDRAIHFAGVVSDRALAAWYATCAFFVMPSRDEGFGLVFLEAMRAGKACIGAPGAAAEVIVDGVTGTIVASPEERALVDALVRMFEDPARRDELGRAGQRRFEQLFTAAHFADRVRELVNVAHASEGEAA
jgi:glycosyltransferase involved in cell wall biosynthesis